MLKGSRQECKLYEAYEADQVLSEGNEADPAATTISWSSNSEPNSSIKSFWSGLSE